MAKYSVTIMNDTSFLDGHGFIHTWLVLKSEDDNAIYKNDSIYIGFTTEESALQGAMPLDTQGVFQGKDELKDRPSSKQISFEINKEQYNAILNKSNYYKDNPPKYDMGSDGDGDFNCITIAHDILSAGGIYFLQGIQTPYGLRAKIWPNNSACPER